MISERTRQKGELCEFNSERPRKKGELLAVNSEQTRKKGELVVNSERTGKLGELVEQAREQGVCSTALRQPKAASRFGPSESGTVKSGPTTGGAEEAERFSTSMSSTAPLVTVRSASAAPSVRKRLWGKQPDDRNPIVRSHRTPTAQQLAVTHARIQCVGRQPVKASKNNKPAVSTTSKRTRADLDSLEHSHIPQKAKPGSNAYKTVQDNFTWTCNRCHFVARGVTKHACQAARGYHLRTYHKDRRSEANHAFARPVQIIAVANLPVDQRAWTCAHCGLGLPFISDRTPRKSRAAHV